MWLQKFSIKFFGLWIIVKSKRNLVKFNAEWITPEFLRTFGFRP